MPVAYDTLASVYDWLVPDELLTPEGTVAAYPAILEALAPGARVLDCATGTGRLAVGLAQRGFDVVATDASPAMIDRTRAAAASHGVPLGAQVCAWQDLAATVEGRFDAVLCVGNSLTHANGQTGRRTALVAMRAVLRPGALCAVSSRNWEQLRAHPPRLEVGDRLVQRDGRDGVVIHDWTIPAHWDAPHRLGIAVAILGTDRTVDTVAEQLTFWPFTREQLHADLESAGFTDIASTDTLAADRYLVTATAS